MAEEQYRKKFEEIEQQILEMEEVRNLCKWAARTGDEADVVDRDAWKEKIEWAREELDRRGIIGRKI